MDNLLEAYTIDQFCRAHGICRRMWYLLRERGQGPRTMQVGRHERISREAAADWRREREAEAAAARREPQEAA